MIKGGEYSTLWSLRGSCNQLSEELKEDFGEITLGAEGHTVLKMRNRRKGFPGREEHG